MVRSAVMASVLGLSLCASANPQPIAGIAIGDDYASVCSRLEAEANVDPVAGYDYFFNCDDLGLTSEAVTITVLQIAGRDYGAIVSGLEGRVVRLGFVAHTFRSYSREQLTNVAHAEVDDLVGYIQQRVGPPFAVGVLDDQIDDRVVVAAWDAGEAEWSLSVLKGHNATEAAEHEWFTIRVSVTEKGASPRIASGDLVGDYPEAQEAQASLERERELERQRARAAEAAVETGLHAFVQAMFGHVGIVQVVCTTNLWSTNFACGESHLNEAQFRETWDLYADWAARVTVVPRPMTAWEREDDAVSRRYIIPGAYFAVSYSQGAVRIVRLD